MVIPFMAIYCIKILHFDVTQLGWIMAMFGIGSICGAFLGGKLTDKIGFYDPQIFALLSGGVLFIITGFVHTFLNLAIACFILSFFNESFRPANSAAIAYYSSAENKTRSYSLNRLAVNLGWSVGTGLGGILAFYSYHYLFWVDGCTNIIAALILIKLIPRSHIVKPIKEKAELTAHSSAYKDKIYLIFIALMVLFATCFFQLFTMQPLFFKTVWLFNERVIGALMAFNGILIAVIEMVIIHQLEGRRPPLHYIVYGVLITGMGFILLNLMPGVLISGIVVMMFITIGEIMALPFMNSFWIARTSPHNRGEYAALYTMAWSTAQVIAPILGTQIILRSGFGMLWWQVGGVCLVAAVGFGILNRHLIGLKSIRV